MLRLCRTRVLELFLFAICPMVQSMSNITVVGGMWEGEGNILVDGIKVCYNDEFYDNVANVFCKTLGYVGSGRYQEEYLYYLEPTNMLNFECDGTETDIIECTWSETTCRSTLWLGVSCHCGERISSFCRESTMGSCTKSIIILDGGDYQWEGGLSIYGGYRTESFNMTHADEICNVMGFGEAQSYTHMNYFDRGNTNSKFITVITHAECDNSSDSILSYLRPSLVCSEPAWVKRWLIIIISCVIMSCLVLCSYITFKHSRSNRLKDVKDFKDRMMNLKINHQLSAPGITAREKLLAVLKLLLFSIILPTLDIWTDLILIWKICLNVDFNGNGIDSYFSIPLIVCVVLNYLMTTIGWWKNDHEKYVTWIPAALFLYPQYKACQVIYLILRNPKKGIEAKALLKRDISEAELFFEAIPTTFILLTIYGKAVVFKRMHDGDNYARNEVIGELQEVVIEDETMFIFTWVTSFLSASLGLSRRLDEGPCSVLPGTSRFGLVFLAVTCTFGSKLLMVWESMSQANASGDNTDCINFISKKSFPYCIEAGFEEAIVIVICCFICGPQLLMTFFSKCRHKDICTATAEHPSLLFLPVLSYFTFEEWTPSSANLCSSVNKSDNKNQAEGLCFSARGTIVNMVISTMMTSAWCMIRFSKRGVLMTYLRVIPTVLYGILSTSMFLLVNSKSPRLLILKYEDHDTWYIEDENENGEARIITKKEYEEGNYEKLTDLIKEGAAAQSESTKFPAEMPLTQLDFLQIQLWEKQIEIGENAKVAKSTFHATWDAKDISKVICEEDKKEESLPNESIFGL